MLRLYRTHPVPPHAFGGFAHRPPVRRHGRWPSVWTGARGVGVGGRRACPGRPRTGMNGNRPFGRARVGSRVRVGAAPRPVRTPAWTVTVRLDGRASGGTRRTRSTIGRPVGWSAGRLDGRSVGRLVGWPVGRLDGLTVGRSVGRLAGWLVGRLDGRDVACYVSTVRTGRVPPHAFGGFAHRPPVRRHER